MDLDELRRRCELARAEHDAWWETVMADAERTLAEGNALWRYTPWGEAQDRRLKARLRHAALTLAAATDGAEPKGLDWAFRAAGCQPETARLRLQELRRAKAKAG